MTLGEWSAAAVAPADGDDPPEPGDPDDWVAVDLPGRPERFAGEDCVAYRTRFADPRSGGDDRALLELSGLFARGRVWHNGELLGSHDAYFVPARFDFEPDDDNEVVVECRGPDRFGGVHDTDLVAAADSVPGVWWDAGVTTYAGATVCGVDVETALHDEGATIRATATVTAAEAVEDQVTFSLRPEGFRSGGMMERSGFSADAGETVRVTHDVELHDPVLWWPRGRGSQHRYTVRALLDGQGRGATTGLVDVTYGDDGLAVNGERIRGHGFALLPSGDHADGSAAADGGRSAAADEELSAAGEELSPAADVERAAAADATLLRAHAHVPPHELHDAADEAGLLVWQDLPLTGPGGYDIGRARELATALVSEYGHHPSVAVYGVHDDPRRPFADGVGSGRLGRYRVRWRAWRAGYDAHPDARVAESFGDAVVFPVTGAPGLGADATSLYPGWDYGTADDVTWLLDRNPALGTVVGEFGAGALADGAVEETAGFDRGKHDARTPGDDVAASQAYQARVLKTVAETLRRRGSHALLALALRDTGDAGLGVLARDGDPKAGYGAVADSFAPVQATLEPYPTAGGQSSVQVLNDTPDSVGGTVTWTVGGEETSADVSVPPFDSAGAGTVDVPADAERVTLSLSLPDRTVENEYPLS